LLGVFALFRVPGYDLAGVLIGMAFCVVRRNSEVIPFIAATVFCFVLTLLADSEVIHIPWWIICLPLLLMAFIFLKEGFYENWRPDVWPKQTRKDLEAVGVVIIAHIALALLSGVYIPVCIYRWVVLYCCMASGGFSLALSLFNDQIIVSALRLSPPVRVLTRIGIRTI
jgi:hypothetical protein